MPKTKRGWRKAPKRTEAQLLADLAVLGQEMRILRNERDELQRRVEDADSLNATLERQVEDHERQIESQHALLLTRNEQGNGLANLVLDLFEIIALQAHPAPQADLAQKLARAVGKVHLIRPFV